jgi:hypothetical protein
MLLFDWLNTYGVFLILSASSLFIFFDLCMKTNYDNKQIIDIPEKFEDKYIKDINKLEERNLSKDELILLQKSIVMENTPMGNVILFYFHEKEQFIFYSDRKEVPYKYLDAVARKYIKMFDCKMIYTAVDEELESQKKKYEEIKEERKIIKPERTEKKRDVFANYKNYNMKTDTPLKEEDYLIKENINKFKWGGFLKDYQFIQTQKKEEKELTYQDFMIQMSSKNST